MASIRKTPSEGRNTPARWVTVSQRFRTKRDAKDRVWRSEDEMVGVV